MEINVIYSLIGLFLITVLTNILATLKSMLQSKRIMNPVYFLVFVDSVIFATTVSKVTSSEGIHYTIAYALGRTAGVLIGNKIDLVKDVGRVLKENEIREFAEGKKSTYIETSAKTGEKVEEAFKELTKRIASQKGLSL